ncbi:MAG: bifunctional diaminohydroxyphosphoribosylaminopyrimidine deaminase/5-amino-6-(5-phosphoribosylamino)uracil reductase RibD [Bacteroidales bacterium]|jgi:diaminohydroxyphosphoribosylaminopyrimidine deaminase/5-amino-6-(5-phosphoribosylamino)uracil reductase|nr:bifunctional diaminohydroxyphosphoribosylaminopyrimidine deaminase/5-amino-6-(5-phosphoribosylamino)uracil reductase RibD [Bacteroidales bacterium]
MMRIFAAHFERMDYEAYMHRCLELARLGTGYTAPNPMVGCVIVHEGRIIGEGWHRQYGEPHAEMNAIRSVQQKHLLPSSTLFVNLEPCAHVGKTPPCADKIIAERIPQVVTGSVDPNPLVAGKGVERLRNAGCHVTTGVLEEECSRLNVRFMTFHKQRRPYVLLKWAQTADGFIDVIRSNTFSARPTWITGEYERTLVHKWRSEESAILVGTNTALMDNPMLNLRQWTGKQPLRIVIDRTQRLPASLHLFDGSQSTLVFTEKSVNPLSDVDYAVVPFDNRLPFHILDELYSRNIASVLIEGGAQLLQTFIHAGLWDEARIFTSKMCFGNGIPAPEINGKFCDEYKMHDSELRIFENKITFAPTNK